MMAQSLSVCLPAYNDEATVGRVIEDAVRVLAERGIDYEVIVVNDGSRDRTSDVAQALAQRNPRIRVISHATNRGYGAAVRTALHAATKPFAFYTDSDGQYDVQEMPQLLAHAGEAELVNGYKIARADRWSRRWIGRGYARMARWCFGVTIRDVNCDFRLIRTDVLRRLLLSASQGAIGLDLVTQMQRQGCRIVEVPVHHYPRVAGRSQFFHWRPLWTTAVELCRIWWRLRTSSAPLSMAQRPW